MLINTGELKDRVLIAKQSATTDTQGGRAVTWVDLISGNASSWTKWWAKVEPIVTDETLPASTAITALQTYRVILRYRADITAKMRVLWTPYSTATATQKTLEIHGVRLLHGRAFLQLDCAEAI